jgi:hypothetical protein
MAGGSGSDNEAAVRQPHKDGTAPMYISLAREHVNEGKAGAVYSAVFSGVDPD